MLRYFHCCAAHPVYYSLFPVYSVSYMALFTGRGDDGTTKTYGAKDRVSKGSSIAEALGTMDELNSFLGLLKVKAAAAGFEAPLGSVKDIVHGIQQTLFVVQTELAGYPMTVEAEKVEELSAIVNTIEQELPPIKTFFISGGTELAAMCDVARTLARRAERRVVGVRDGGLATIGPHSLAFLNRLSSVLYALARLANHKAGIVETPPDYNGEKEDPSASGAPKPLSQEKPLG